MEELKSMILEERKTIVIGSTKVNVPMDRGANLSTSVPYAVKWVMELIIVKEQESMKT